MFGVYTPTYQYGFIEIHMALLPGMIYRPVGNGSRHTNYYNPEKGWNVVPIVIPRYKFKKFDIGIDVGGLLYETIRK